MADAYHFMMEKDVEKGAFHAPDALGMEFPAGAAILQEAAARCAAAGGAAAAGAAAAPAVPGAVQASPGVLLQQRVRCGNEPGDPLGPVKAVRRRRCRQQPHINLTRHNSHK